MGTFVPLVNRFKGTFVDIGTRLRGERERLGLNQMDLAGCAGIGRKSQFNYESGDRLPDAGYLAAVATAGVDVLYVVTGERDAAPETRLPAQEQRLLALFRLADPSVQMAVLGALSTGSAGPLAPRQRQSGVVVVHGDVGQTFEGGNHAPQTINVGTGRPRKRGP